MIPPIFATLSANAGVTAIIGAGDNCRCYPFGFAKQGTVIPYVTWFKVSGQPVNKLTKGSFTDRIRAQVDCWSNDSAGALVLARAVRASLETKGYMVGLNLTERDIETRLYRYSMDFEFIVNRAVTGVIAPVADFVGSVVSGNAPLTVNFTDLSTNTPTSWSWNFGDATTSTAQNPTKIYTVPGVYTVTLIATNAAGSDTKVRTSYIVASFNPASLFVGGYTGGWYDPSDLSTLWQNSARTVPVTADGDPVGAIDDKSGNGNHLIQATAGARPLYKTSGGLHWLDFDGIDDVVENTAYANPSVLTMIDCRADDTTTAASRTSFGSWESNQGFNLRQQPDGAISVLTGNGSTFQTTNITHTFVANEVYVHSGGYDGTNVMVRYNNGTRTTSAKTFVARAANGFMLGRSPHDTNSDFDGKWYGGLYINRFLTNGEQDSYVTSVGAKGGLSL